MARVCVLACFFSCCLLAFSVFLAACGDHHPLKPETEFGAVIIDAFPDSISGPWRLDGPSGSVSVGAGDTFMGGMEPGRYRLTWAAVVGWSPPVPTSCTDSLAAEVVVVFTDDIPQVNGQVCLLAPAGAQYIGDAVPERMGCI